jgi:hypothetical protein
LLNQAGYTPRGGAWLFLSQKQGLPAAGVAMSALDFKDCGGVKKLGFLHAAVDAPVEIPQVSRIVVDLFHAHEIQFLDREASNPDAAILTHAVFEEAHPRRWIEEIDSQSQILVIAYTDIFLAARFFEEEDNPAPLVSRMFQHLFLGLAPLTLRLTPLGGIAHRSPLDHYGS